MAVVCTALSEEDNAVERASSGCLGECYGCIGSIMCAGE